MPYVLTICLVVLAAIAIAQFVAPRVGAAAARRRRSIAPGGSRSGAYEWDRRTDQVRRQLHRVSGPTEYRDEMVEWIAAHDGVEAYVEPKTVMHPLSVVLVDGRGASRRFELKEDTYLRELARERGLPVFDAGRVGYPERMRRFREHPD